MDDTIITIYCLCKKLLETIGHRDDPQVRLSTAEVTTVALVSAAFFSGDIDKTRLFVHEYGRLRPVLGTAPGSMQQYAKQISGLHPPCPNAKRIQTRISSAVINTVKTVVWV